MLSSNTRATRSRYSSPAQQQQQQNGTNGSFDGGRPSDASRGNGVGNVGGGAGSVNDATSRTFMDKWLEPAIQNKTSFEEAGLMRYGVLENMAPLGTLPKPKKTGPEGGNSAVRRIILRQSVKSSEKPTRESSPAPSKNSADSGISGSGKGTAGSTTTITSAPSATAANATAAASEAPSASVTTAAEPGAPVPSEPLQPGSPTAPAAATISSTSTSLRPARRSLPARAPQPVFFEEVDQDYDPKKSTRRKSLGRPALPKRGRPPSSVRRDSMVSSTKTSPVKARPVTPPTPSGTTVQREAQAQEVAQVHAHGPEFLEKVIEAAVDEAIHHHRYPTAWALRTLYDENIGNAEFAAMLEEVFTQTANAKTREEFARRVEAKKREGKRGNQGRHYFIPPADDGHITPYKPKAAPYASLLVHHRNGSGAQSGRQEEGERRATKKIKISHRRSDSTPHKMSSSGNGAVKTPGSRRRKGRRGSGSSESSLSSLEHLSSPELPAGSDLVTSATVASPSMRGAGGGGEGAAKAKLKAKGRPVHLNLSSKARAAAAAAAGVGGETAVAPGAAEVGATGTKPSNSSNSAAAAADAAMHPHSPTHSAPQPISTGRKSLPLAKRPGGAEHRRPSSSSNSNTSSNRLQQNNSQHHHPPPQHQHKQAQAQAQAQSRSQALLDPSPDAASASPSISPSSPTRDDKTNHSHSRSHSHSHSHTRPHQPRQQQDQGELSDNRQQNLDDHDSMPGRVASTPLDSLSTQGKDKSKAVKSTAASSSSLPAVKGAGGAAGSKGGSSSSTPMQDEQFDAAWDRRMEAQKITNGYTAMESSVRHGEENIASGLMSTPARSTRRTRQSVLPPASSTRSTRSANKRVGDDYPERYASPGVMSVSVQGDGSSVVGSRAVTPTNLRPAKKQKTGLRVKSS